MPTEKTDPIQISFFGAVAIMQIPNPLPHLIKQTSGLQQWFAEFRGFCNCIKIQNINRRAR